MKKLISLFLAVLMIVATMPMAFAAEELAPVLIDPVNDPPVATAVEAGARLNTSTISGGAVKHPETGEILTDAVWKWQSSRTKVNAAGMYPAYCAHSSLDYPLMMDIYVDIIGNAVETEITSVPTIDSITYDGITKLGEIKLNGGVAVEKGTENTIEGVFSLVSNSGNSVADNIPNAGEYTIKVKFTPNDTEKYLPCEAPITFTVNPAIPTWKDGEAVITVPYGTKINSGFDVYVKNALDDSTGGLLRTWSYKTIDGEEITRDFLPSVGTHEVTADLNLNGTGSQNYQTNTTMTFTLVVEGKTLDCKVSSCYAGGYQVIDSSLDYSATKPQGTFTVIGKLGDKVISENTVKYGEIFETNEVDSGTYVYTMKYNPTQNDPFVIADSTSEFKYLRPWNVSINGEYNYTHKAGDVVNVKTNILTDFKGWKITDASGNAISVVLVDTSVDPIKEIGVADGFTESSDFYFVMPEGDVVFTAEYKSAGDIGDIDGIEDISDFFAKIIAWLKGIIEKIITFFKSIGDFS